MNLAEVMESILCHTCGKSNRPGAERLIALLDFEAFGDPGSNDCRLSEDAAMHFECLLADCEGKLHCGLRHVLIYYITILTFVYATNTQL